MKRMKKLLLLLVCLAVLIGTTAVVSRLTQEDGTDMQEEAVTVYSLDTQSVTRLGWDYSEELFFVATDDGWEYETDDTFPLDESYIDAMLETLSQITATKTIEGVTDWDQYGLEIPVCTVTVGTGELTQILRIGEETSLGGERYFSIGDGNVYLVDSTVIDCFSYGLYDVLALETIPTMTTVTAVEVASDEQTYTIEYLENSGLTYTDDYVWYMDGRALDNELTEALIEALTALSWEECVAYNADDPAAYGLETPAAVVTVRYMETVTVQTGETDDSGNALTQTQDRDASFTLQIGNTVEDSRYARILGSDMVYRIDGGLCDTLMYTTYNELMPDEVLLMDWDALKALEITLDGTVYEIVKDTKTVTDENGNETEETVYLLDAEEVAAQDILTALDAVTSTGYATGITPERSEELRILIRREHETYPELVLTFYQYDSAQCLTTLNGQATVFADREQVVALVETATQLVLGG